MHLIFEPGVFANPQVQTALLIGFFASTLSALVGVFTVLRRQAFTGHAITDMATAGGSVGFYFGLKTIIGFLIGSLAGGYSVEKLEQKNHNDDLSAAIVLGGFSGLSALFIYLESTNSASSSVSQQILFGSIFSFDHALIWPLTILTAISFIAIITLFNQLLLLSISEELSQARGKKLRAIRYIFIAILALAVAISSLVIGSILSTALLIAPANISLRIARTIKKAALLSLLISYLATAGGIILAYDSFYWSSSGRGLPVSFLIVAILITIYLLVKLSEFPKLRAIYRLKRVNSFDKAGV
jgi:zinc/manganese transport system permease protein